MATTIVSESTHLVDSAIGPLAVTEKELTGFDIDDYVHTTVRSQAILLRMKEKAGTADPAFAADRPPVDIEDVSVGGF